MFQIVLRSVSNNSSVPILRDEIIDPHKYPTKEKALKQLDNIRITFNETFKTISYLTLKEV